jgi:hypothetical protein
MLNAGSRIGIYEVLAVLGLDLRATAAGWTPDSRGLLWYQQDVFPVRVMKLDLATGRSELWKEIQAPRNEVGVTGLHFTPDGKSYAFSNPSDVGDLYVLKGAK